MGKKNGTAFRVRLLIRKLIQKALPRKIRHALLRRFLELDPAPSPRLKVRLARTQEELEAAFGLLHDAYVKSGFMDPHDSGLRVTKYHSLPATSTIIALWDGEVVGTVSLIRKSSFGMPLESIFDVSHLTDDGSRIFETSSLAVHPRFSGQHGMVLFPLIKFFVEYAYNYFGSKYMAIAVNPAWIEFYEAIFGVTRLTPKPIDNYLFVKGAPAIGAYVDLISAPVDLVKIYGKNPIQKNMREYLFNLKMPNLEFPDRKFSKISDPVLTPELIDYFFNIKTQTFTTMTEREVLTLHQLYQDNDFKAILPPQPIVSNVWKMRADIRLEVNYTGYIYLPQNIRIPIFITEISRGGMSIVTDRDLRADEFFSIVVMVDGVEHRLPRAKMIWTFSNQRRCGIILLEIPASWENMVTILRNDILMKVS